MQKNESNSHPLWSHMCDQKNYTRYSDANTFPEQYH